MRRCEAVASAMFLFGIVAIGLMKIYQPWLLLIMPLYGVLVARVYDRLREERDPYADEAVAAMVMALIFFSLGIFLGSL